MNRKVCLCCGKEIEEGTWHVKCIKRFFGGTTLPEIDLNLDQLEKVAISQINDRRGVAGVQEKLSLHLDLEKGKRPRLTIFGLPSGYILKPQSSTYKRLPEFEHTAMLLASECSLSVVEHGLLPIQGGELAYITKRIDRTKNGKIHMEDFCQATGTLTADKYRSSYEECAKLIARYSDKAFFDVTKLFAFLYFCFVIGNSDIHLKNLSFIMDGRGALSLSPFYDILPTKVVLPSDHDDLGMLFNGKKTNLRKHDFDAFAEAIGISSAAKEKIIGQIDAKYDAMCQIIDDSPLDQNSKSSWKRMMASNIKRAKRP